MFLYNISFFLKYFYKNCITFQLLTNGFIPNIIKEAVQLQASVTNKGI